MVKEEMGEEKLKKMAELKARVEKRVEEMEAELEELRVLLESIDAFLLEKGFRRAEIVKPTPVSVLPEVAPPSPVVEYEKAIPLKTVTGDLLANIYATEDSIRVVLAEDKEFSINTPPSTPFLVERVLTKMQERDREAASTGEITPEKILSYNIVRDGDLVREITIRNIGSDRLQELKSTIRWTLEKMYEKMSQSG